VAAQNQRHLINTSLQRGDHERALDPVTVSTVFLPEPVKTASKILSQSLVTSLKRGVNENIG